MTKEDHKIVIDSKEYKRRITEITKITKIAKQNRNLQLNFRRK
jgi:hypothetical protein